MKTLKPSEIAAYCDVHQRTVSRWIANGDLKGHKLPGRGNYRVLLDDFLLFLQKFQIPLPAELQNLTQTSVLVIDDETGYRNSLKRLFVQQGFKVTTAKDGFAAGVNLLAEKPQLVTLDLQMPGLDGFDVLHYIRQRADLNDIKIVVISGLAQAELDVAKAAGADAVLAKPFENHVLIQLVNQLLNRS